MNDPLAMATLSATAELVKPGSRQSLALGGFMAGGVLAVALLLAGMPLVSMCVFAASCVSSLVIDSVTTASARNSGRCLVDPDDIVSAEVRSTYQGIVRGLADVERALAAAPRLHKSMTTAIQRARAAVGLSGQIAILANPLQRYLDSHHEAFIRSEHDRLRERTETASDDTAIGAWGHAAAARARQLEIHKQMVAQRDRICARLELVRAALETFSAMIVRLHALNEEQIVLAGESVAEQLEGIGDDLELLESALEIDTAA